MAHRISVVIVLGCILLAFARDAAGQTTQAADAMTEHPPADAVELLAKLVDAGGEDVESTRFALGIAQTLYAAETLGKGIYKLGPRDDTLISGLPILRFPVPDNPDPDVASIAALNELLETFAADLATARKTLESVDGNVELSLPISLIAFDFDGDGVSGKNETLGDVLYELGLVNPRPGAGSAEYFIVDFDTADVQWLIAYTHVIEGFAEMLLAFDASDLFDHSGHLLFKRTDSEFRFLEGQSGFNIQLGSIADFAAFLHTMKMPVREGDHLEKARNHFLAAIEHSRKTFELIADEDDDEHEWIPNPRQTSAFDVQVSQDVVDAWLSFLDDAQGVLDGERLLPFWRTDNGQGVNLRRAMDESDEVDFILWFQGTAAVPYLENDKPLVTAESFRRMQRMTGGNFWTFAAWFN